MTIDLDALIAKERSLFEQAKIATGQPNIRRSILDGNYPPDMEQEWQGWLACAAYRDKSLDAAVTAYEGATPTRVLALSKHFYGNQADITSRSDMECMFEEIARLTSWIANIHADRNSWRVAYRGRLDAIVSLDSFTKRLSDFIVSIAPELSFVYKNYKNVVENRHVRPIKIYRGATMYHKEEQYLLQAFDIDRSEERHFAIADIDMATLAAINADPVCVAAIDPADGEKLSVDASEVGSVESVLGDISKL